MSCDVGEVTERLENELCYDYDYELCSFSNLSVTSPTSQLILQPFRRIIYVTAHPPTLLLLHLRHISFSNPYFASPTSQDLHLIHLASRPWKLDWQKMTTKHRHKRHEIRIANMECCEKYRRGYEGDGCKRMEEKNRE